MNRQRTWLYSLVRVLAKIVYTVFFGFRTGGAEHFPKEGGFIVFGNHTSAWDPITIALAYPQGEVHFIAKESLFKRRWIAALLKKIHAFPVNRGGTDMGAMRAAMQVLRNGEVLGIFPEGQRRRDGHVRGVETGLAVMAMKSGAPLVPVLITGRYRLFGRVRAVVGEPLDLADLRAGRADAQALEDVKARIMDALEALRPLAAR